MLENIHFDANTNLILYPQTCNSTIITFVQKDHSFVFVQERVEWKEFHWTRHIFCSHFTVSHTSKLKLVVLNKWLHYQQLFSKWYFFYMTFLPAEFFAVEFFHLAIFTMAFFPFGFFFNASLSVANSGDPDQTAKIAITCSLYYL